jgi:hypothetical protein
MLVISAVPLTGEEIDEHALDCGLVDYASIIQAEINNSSTFEGCTQTPAYSVAFKPAEDMVIPIFLCKLHFNALSLSLHEGVGVDEDVFGEFPEH